ncbi:hybrid nrps pks [Ophiostoma piceae UAMH 11346]|uniref:Hybrid nrps pks n=1 Tax=Ophiostoma piceae (strain UAMH 11346) TaxID=1262450 RepID=S3C911_OPHP1|nr:hybrid nrps pks [Ophiostoma piceae UAMH 11346]
MPYKPSPSEPIAVVASSCRFTGGATSPSKLWDLLKEPTDLTRPVPPSRFNIHAFHHPEGDYHGTTDAPNSYFLDDEQDPRAFDTGFFGIAPKEAEAVDPQQRLLLETVYEALESAGYKLPEWTGKDVAVYVGAMTSDFDSMSQRDDLTTSPYYATGNARSILSNRISYFFDFHGPSATIDTACSSSLVALHHAVLSLRAGDCSAACVAGVNLMLAPEQFVVESSLHMLSPAGHCHMWDKRADGYARGEGAAVVLLKPLSRALADGDASRIQGIIRETGVGSDGRTSGITMPSPDAQASLIRSTYQRAGLDLADPADWCQYFEAHGTGTPVGDPREAQAIHSAFFGPDHAASTLSSNPPAIKEKLLVGSVKTVIGHTEGAAGLAGILKVMLAMKNAQIPPNLHMVELNPTVAPFCTPSSTQKGHLEVVSKLQSWPERPVGQPMRASVNSFGFGGTNAHAIIEHYDASIHTTAVNLESYAQTATPAVGLPHIPLLLSATSPSSLRALARQYQNYLQKLQDGDSRVSFQEVAWRVHASRTSFIQRLSISASDRVTAISFLSRLTSVEEFGVRARRIDGPLKLVGIFTGQGAQWAGMSKHLLLTSRIYRDAIQSLDAVLQACPHPPTWSIETELQKLDSEGSRVKEAAISQPLCTALQIGLVTLLQLLGVQFSCVVGHSSGEIAAAFAAGRISSKDAILIAYYRGLSVSHPKMERLQGGMLAVGLSYADAAKFCEEFAGKLCVAASNSPSSTTLSGDVEAVERAESLLKGDKVFARRLVVDKAYHSHHMANFSGIYSGYLAACQVVPLETDDDSEKPLWISSVFPTGDAPTKEQLTSQYWVDNMVQPVLFHEAVEKALCLGDFQDGIDGAIEVGPHSTLKGPFLDTYAEARALPTATLGAPVYTSLIRRSQRDDLALQEFVGFMSAHFDPSPINMAGLLGADEQIVLEASLAKMYGDDAEKLPAYVWDHSQIYYRQSRIVRQFHHQTEVPHELLGTRTRDDVDGCELRWRNLLRVDKLPWLAHHAFQGQPLFPASAYCIMALDAAKALLAGRAATLIEVEDIEFIGGIPLEIDGPATEIMFSLMVQSPSKMAAISTKSSTNLQETIQANFSVYATPEASESSMRKRCSGRIRIVLGELDKDALPSRTDPSEQPETFPVPIESFYGMMANVGLSYSGPFEAIESLQRRHDFASASLKRFHADDTTGLAISPATLDSCLQSCFATFSSPGDKALWTAFLPIHMKRVTFNMAHKGVGGAAGPKRMRSSVSSQEGGSYSVDAELTHFQEATLDSPSRITGDILIYNDDGEMEVMVEALTVGSFASSDPSKDRELYLHTKYATDPEHALEMGTPTSDMDEDDVVYGFHDVDYRVLEESCERVGSFGQSASPWPLETEETLEQYILASQYSMTLEKIRKLAPASTMDQQYQTIMEEGRHASQFQRQLSRIVKQIVHRYPRMSVLSLTDADVCLSLPIASGLGSSFTSYTSTTVGADRGFANYLETQPEYLTQKLHVISLNDAHEIIKTLSSNTSIAQQTPLDLVIMSTSIFKQLASSEAVLARIKDLMRPGGFLLLVHMPIAIVSKSKMTARFENDGDQLSLSSSDGAMITPPDWPDLLEQSGFMNPEIANTDQHYPGGFSITVRQCESHFKNSLAVVQHSDAKLKKKVLIIGGATAGTISLASATSQLLSSHLDGDAMVVHGIDGLAGVSPTTLASFTSAIVLADLDDYQPVLSTLDEQRLDDLRSFLLVPDLTILWVTKGARNGNAECAASYGFTRSVRAEIPSLTLQMLDFDHLQMVNGQLRAPGPIRSSGSIESSATKPLAASVIVNQFLQLLLAKAENESRRLETGQTSHLWNLETELFIGYDGVCLIPRMVPFAPGNDNFNASRRVVTRQINTLSTCVEVVRDDPSTSTYTTRIGPTIASLLDASHLDTGISVIKVLYSTNDPLYNGYFLCIGRDELSGNTVATMSESSASFVSVPRQQTVPLGKAIAVFETSPGAYTSFLSKMLVCQSMCQSLDSKNPLVLVAPDDLLLRCAQIMATTNQQTTLSIQVTARKTMGANKNTIHIHPRSTPSQIKSALRRFGEGTTLISFLPADHVVAQHVRKYLAVGCTYQSWEQVGQRHVSTGDARETSDAAFAFLKMAVAIAGQNLGEITPTRKVPELVSLPFLIRTTEHASPSPSIIDWRADRVALHTERPLQDFSGRRHTDMGSGITLRDNCTYVLIGITHDMGQSLATLFVRQGARYLVLASRTHVDTQPRWAKQLHIVYGAIVRFEALDVTNLASVRRFRCGIEKNMPHVGGVVNGAMVLDDRVFTHMTADTFSRVMHPKTVGSRNLDTVFRGDGNDADSNLDFFIMTSSFAAPGGHAGQSNYAAANMYMNGLAANRQRRGVAGSVLNIGVIYGLGFLHREKGELYAGLEREGYPPISERDLHHMFLEAIRQGRPKTRAADRAKPIVDLTTGLSRYDPNQSPENVLHWHNDPRFSHFTVRGTDSIDTAVDGKAADNSSIKLLTDMIIHASAPADVIGQQIVVAFIERLSTLLHLNGGSAIRGDNNLAELGVDSLVAVETRTWLWRTTGQDVPVMRILGSPSINKLCMDIGHAIVTGREEK